MERQPWLGRIEVRVVLVALGLLYFASAALLLSGDSEDRWAIAMFAVAGALICGVSLQGVSAARWLRLVALALAFFAAVVLVAAVVTISTFGF